MNFPLLVPILISLSDCINSSSLFPVAILCTLLHRENTSWDGGVAFTHTIGHNRPPSTVNDPSTTKMNEFKKIMPWRLVPNTSITSHPVLLVHGSSPWWLSQEWVHQEPCQLHHEEEEELCPYFWFLRAPASFCFNCCNVDNACWKSGLCSTGKILQPVLFWSQPPIAIVMVMVIFLWVRSWVWSSSATTSIFSTIFNHSITECFILYESIMDAQEKLLLVLLLQLVGNIIFPVSRLLTISMSVKSSFLYDVLGNFFNSIIHVMNFWFSPLPSRKKNPHVQWTKPMFQKINILCTAFWVPPSRIIHTKRCSQHHESFVLTPDWND